VEQSVGFTLAQHQTQIHPFLLVLASWWFIGVPLPGK